MCSMGVHVGALLLRWVALLTAAQRSVAGTTTLEDALEEIATVVDALGAPRAWDSCSAGATGEQCRLDVSFDLMEMAAMEEHGAVDWCASRATWCTWCTTTCAHASAAGAFDCSSVSNDLALQPETIACGAGVCIAAECCTVVPHGEAREQFEQALAAAPPISEWLAVSSSIVFAADVSDLAEGSAARSEFEFEFKVAMARALGDGATVPAEHIFVDGIRPGSIVVEWHALVPPNVTSTASSLILQLTEDGETIEVTTAGGLTFAGDPSSIEQPSVTSPSDQEQELAPEPEPESTSTEHAQELAPEPEPTLKSQPPPSTDEDEEQFMYMMIGGAVLVATLLCVTAVACCVVCLVLHKTDHAETAEQKEEEWMPFGPGTDTELSKKLERFTGRFKAEREASGGGEETLDHAAFMTWMLGLATQDMDTEEGVPELELEPEPEPEPGLEPEPEPELQLEPEPEPDPKHTPYTAAASVSTRTDTPPRTKHVSATATAAATTRAGTPPRQVTRPPRRVTRPPVSASSSDSGGEVAQAASTTRPDTSLSWGGAKAIDVANEVADSSSRSARKSSSVRGAAASSSIDTQEGPDLQYRAQRWADPPEPQAARATAVATVSTSATRAGTPPRRVTRPPVSASSSDSGGEVAGKAAQAASTTRPDTPPRMRDSPKLLEQIATLCAREDLGYPSEERVRSALKAKRGRGLDSRRQQVEAIKVLRASAKALKTDDREAHQ